MYVVREVFDDVARYSRIFYTHYECLRYAEIRRKVLNASWSVSVITLRVSSVECVRC